MKKLCALVLTLAMVISALPLSFAVMITGIQYEPIKKQYFYETEGEWRQDGGDYFHYNIKFNIGDLLTEELDDGSNDCYECRYNDEEGRMEFVNIENDWDVITLDRLEIIDNQEQMHWDLGENSFQINMGGKYAAATVTVVENPVESIYYEPQNFPVFYEECGGQWEQTQSGERFYHYNLDMPQEGDTLYVSYVDGSETEFRAYFDEQEQCYYFESDAGERLEYGQFGVYGFDDQDIEPFQVGSDNYYHIVYSGRNYDVSVTIDPNPVQAITYEPRHEKKFFYESGGWWDTDESGTPFYRYDLRYMEPGDTLHVIDVYDEDTAYTAAWDEEADEMVFRSADGDTIFQEDLEFYDEQQRNPFNLGDDNYYYVRYYGREYAVPVSIVENTVASISYTAVKPIVLYLNTNGQWETDSSGESYFRYFGGIRLQDGDILTLTDKDGVSTDYISRWNEQRDCREYVSAQGAVIDEDDIIARDQQYQSHWTLGNQNYFYIEYAGHSVAVQVTVAENPVSAVHFIPATPAVIYENSGGNWEQDAQGHAWYNYSIPYFEEGDVLEITYADSGETVAYTYTFDAESYESCFIDSEGQVLETEENLYLSRTGRWDVGEDNTYRVVYFNVESNPISVSIVPSPIQAIAYIPAQPKVCYFESGGEWETGYDDQPYYRYHFTRVERGDTLRVTDAEGITTDYVAEYNDDSYSFYFRSAAGEIIDEAELDFFDEQYRNHFVIGDENAYYVEYLGKQAVVPVSIIVSPLTGLSYVPQQPIEVFENTDGYWTTDDDGNPYFYYFYQRIRSGDRLILTYPDSAPKTFTAQWNEAQGQFYFICGTESIDEDALQFTDRQYETPFSAGTDNEIYVSCLGQTCAIPVTVRENPVKAVEFIPAKEATYIEYTHGYWEGDESGEPYFEYELPYWEEGDVIRVTGADDAVSVYTYAYNESAGYSGFFDSEGKEIDTSKLYRERNDEALWTVGGENIYWIDYFGVASNPVAVNIIENPVLAISYTPVKAAQYLEHSDGYWDEGDGFYYYNLPRKHLGDVLCITDRQGEVTAYTLIEDTSGEWVFQSAGGDTINSYEVSFDSQQYQTPWTRGDQNAYTVQYCGVEATLYASIAENTVQGIRFVPTKPIVLDEGAGGRFVPQEHLLIYDIPIYTGDKLEVSYQNGEVVVYEVDMGNMSLKAPDGREIDTDMVNLYSTQNFNPWVPGSDNVFTIEYAGFSQDVTVTITERFTVNVVAPTCTQWGYTEHTDSNSGNSYRSAYVDALGHDFSLRIVDESTMRTAPGSEEGATYYFTCARCGELSKSEDLWFKPDTGVIYGHIDTSQYYHYVMADLYQGDTMIIGTAIQYDGIFRFDNLEPGTYSVKLRAVNSPLVEITGITVTANGFTSMSDSENEALQNLRVAVGDCNGDGVIDFADLSALLAAGSYGSEWGSERYEERLDLNDDGVINARDINLLLSENNYGAQEQTLVY